MKAIILAAGRGSRMGELTVDRPKCMTMLKGKSLIDIQLDALRHEKIDEVGIVGGYKAEFLINKSDRLFINDAWETTNMVCSLEVANEWLEKHACIISYSDIFYEERAIDLLVNSNKDISITYDPNWLDLWGKRFSDPLSDAETFRVNDQGILQEIGGSPKKIEEIQGQYMGLLKVTPRGWKDIKKILDGMGPLKNKLHMTGLLQMMISQEGAEVAAIRYEGKWGEIDSQSDLLAYL